MNHLDSDGPDRPSKSQRKRDATALQTLGETLTGLSAAKLARVPLAPELRKAIEDYSRLPNSHGARKRQLQFIGKLMRDCDADEIRASLDRLDGNDQSAADSARHQDMADRILAQGDPLINRLLDSHPLLERQKLRQLLRDHRRATAEEQQQRRQKLIDYLRQSLS